MKDVVFESEDLIEKMAHSLGEFPVKGPGVVWEATFDMSELDGVREVFPSPNPSAKDSVMVVRWIHDPPMSVPPTFTPSLPLLGEDEVVGGYFKRGKWGNVTFYEFIKMCLSGKMPATFKLNITHVEVLPDGTLVPIREENSPL